MRPPGTANCSSFCSANRETILEKMGLQVSLPSLSFDTKPGRTSISMPTCKIIVLEPLLFQRTDNFDLPSTRLWEYCHRRHLPSSHQPRNRVYWRRTNEWQLVEAQTWNPAWAREFSSWCTRKVLQCCTWAVQKLGWQGLLRQQYLVKIQWYISHQKFLFLFFFCK